MTTSKSIMTVSTLAIALLFGGGVYVMMNLSGLIKPHIERIATETLGVKVTLGSLDISLQEQTVRAGNLKIGNPKGFEKSHAVVVPEILIALENVSQELVTFKDIAVTGTQVNLEVAQNGTNLQAIKNQIKTTPAQENSESDFQAPKVIINRLALTGGSLNPSVTLLQNQDLEPVGVPDIILTGIGRKENGILIQEAIAQIWAAVAKDLNQLAGQAGLLQGVSPEALKEMGASQVQQFKDQIKDEVDQIGDKIKGIFGN